MRIDKIKARNFVGCKFIDVELKTPITMFIGANGAGKSSIFEAIRLAMTGESVRVPLKKNYSELLLEGEKDGAIEIVDGSGEAYFLELPSGKHSGACEATALPFVLDAQRFARMPVNDRRAFLFGLMGVKTDSSSIKKMLSEGGADEKLVERIAPMLRSGMQAAADDAAGRAREAKGAWKIIAGGEAYGSVKAQTWTAPAATAPSARDMESATIELAKTESELDALTQQLGAATESSRIAAETAGKRANLQECAALLERRKTKLSVDMADLKLVEKKVSELRDAKSSDSAMACPCCMSMVVFAGGVLIPAPQQSSVIAPSTGLEQYTNSMNMLQRAVTNTRREVGESECAAAALAALDSSAPEIPFDVDSLKNKISELKDLLENQKSTIRTIKMDEKRSREATEKTKKAAELHADVCAWENIAAQLSPAGIPSMLLNSALGTINDRLKSSALIAGWKAANIGSDMEISAGDRPYNLLSESEKWRCDALIAEAVSFISDTKMIILDRFDVLDLQGRGDLIALVTELAMSGEIETALLFGTLKSIPAGLPDDVTAIWIENGVVAKSS